MFERNVGRRNYCRKYRNVRADCRSKFFYAGCYLLRIAVSRPIHGMGPYMVLVIFESAENEVSNDTKDVAALVK